MVLWERHCESVRFVRSERHVTRVGPVCDFKVILISVMEKDTGSHLRMEKTPIRKKVEFPKSTKRRD